MNAVKSAVGILLIAVGLGLAAAPLAAATERPDPVVEGVRKELLRLPYYGVFDFLSFKVDQGVVTLMGYAYRPTLKEEAERAVKHIAGVTAVNDQVEALPASAGDDLLRWNVYDAIYRDPFLSRYAPGGGLLWGHRHPFRTSGLMAFAPSPFLGTEPGGDYPIHVIVKEGHVELLGVVDHEGDKTMAAMKARHVPGSLSVDNELVVESGSGEKPKTS